MVVRTAFRLDKELLAALKEKARREQKSLNDLVEELLLECVGNMPNEETKRAIHEAENGVGTSPIGSVKGYRATLLGEGDV